MKRFLKLYSLRGAQDIAAALSAANIQHDTTFETVGYYSAKFAYAIWVEDGADPGRLEQIRCDFESRPIEDIDSLPTSVHMTEGEDTLCRGCKYDLRGQRVDSRCPECAHPYVIIADVECAACQTHFPANFDACWNCGNLIEGGSALDMGDEEGG